MTTRRRRSGKNSRWLLTLLAVVGAGVLLLIFAPMLVMYWVRGYLQKEAFREQLEQTFGHQLKGEVTLAPLSWTGDEVVASEARATLDNGWTAEVESLHLGLDWNAFRQKKWRVVGTGVDSLTLELGEVKGEAPPRKAPVAQPSGGVPEWLRGYLPDSVEVAGVQISRFDLRYPGLWAYRQGQVRIGEWQQGDSSLQFTAEGGTLETPVRLPGQSGPVKLSVVRTSARLSAEELHLKEAKLTWLGRSEITAHGEMRPNEDAWSVAAEFTAVPLKECLNKDWRVRLSGELEGELEMKNTVSKPPVVTGEVRLSDGVLTALPILDELAAYTRVERFKRLTLDKAEAQVRLSGGSQKYEKIILNSNGLMRLEGTLTMTGDEINGNFMLGVTPEALRWLPGAQKHVFTAENPSGPPGLQWTPLRLTGSVKAPREDLTQRLVHGAGRALFSAPGDIAGKGTELLLKPVVGEETAKKPGELIDGATGGAIETGVKLLEGIGSALLGR